MATVNNGAYSIKLPSALFGDINILKQVPRDASSPFNKLAEGILAGMKDARNERIEDEKIALERRDIESVIKQRSAIERLQLAKATTEDALREYEVKKVESEALATLLNAGSLSKLRNVQGQELQNKTLLNGLEIGSKIKQEEIDNQELVRFTNHVNNGGSAEDFKFNENASTDLTEKILDIGNKYYKGEQPVEATTSGTDDEQLPFFARGVPNKDTNREIAQQSINIGKSIQATNPAGAEEYFKKAQTLADNGYLNEVPVEAYEQVFTLLAVIENPETEEARKKADNLLNKLGKIFNLNKFFTGENKPLQQNNTQTPLPVGTPQAQPTTNPTDVGSIINSVLDEQKK